MALILPTHRRSREAISTAGGIVDLRNLHVAVDVDLHKDVLAELIRVVPQCVVGNPLAKATKAKEGVVDLESLSKPALVAIAAEKGISMSLSTKKGAMIEAILSSDAAEAEEDG